MPGVETDPQNLPGLMIAPPIRSFSLCLPPRCPSMSRAIQQLPRPRFLVLACIICIGSHRLLAEPDIGATQSSKSQSVATAKTNRTTPPKPDHIEAFKKLSENDALQLDVFLPDTHPGIGELASDPDDKSRSSDTLQFPAVVLFFGGGWKGGNTGHFAPQAKHFAQRGAVVFCPQYRTQSSHQVPPKVCVSDAKSAIRYIRKNADRFLIDTDRMAVGGGSAGGHLAAATATVDAFDDPKDDPTISTHSSALLLFNPVLDNGPDGGYGHERVRDYWKDFSPAHRVDNDVPPTLVLLGSKDRLLPVATIRRFERRLKALDIRCDVHVFEGAEHGFFNRGPAYDETLQIADDFLVSLDLLPRPPIRRSNSSP